jgi:phospholipid/cholesterol/gamma-HCH transport system substrate-binding protein
MHIDARYDNFPADTFASIYTAGLPGEQVITLEASGSEETLEAGGHIQMTQSALVLEQVIGQFLVDGRGRDRR